MMDFNEFEIRIDKDVYKATKVDNMDKGCNPLCDLSEYCNEICKDKDSDVGCVCAAIIGHYSVFKKQSNNN